MLQSGQRLDDYRIVNFFAGDGMGEIYLAEEVSLGRQVAIKVIRPEAIRYPDSEEGRKVIQLFRREATAIAKLNHPYTHHSRNELGKSGIIWHTEEHER